MELIEQWWLSNPWLFGVIITLPIILFILWKLFIQHRYNDEIYLSDKDLYNHQYFDDSPVYRDNEIVDHSVLEFEQNQPANAVNKSKEFVEENNEAIEPDYADWQQVRAAETQTSDSIAIKEDSLDAQQKIEEHPVDKTEKPKELIIAINIRANREQGFKGSDIFAAMEELGIEHGKMNIFHHYGIEKEPTKHPVFSIANLVKPGTFNPAEQDTFTTPGLIAFLQLPGSLGGRVAFELMLHYSQRLAEMLQGRLEDDRKQPVDAELIDFMRKGIDEFEHS